MNLVSNYVRPDIANSNSIPTSATAPSNRGTTTPVGNTVIPAQNSIQPDVFKAYDEKTLKQMGVVECSTCANRTYQDGSDDSGVSFQSPTHISPASSHAAVRGHEQEHVVRERASAERNGGKVISQSVTIYMSVCPECGRAYSSGGVTKTTTKEPVHTSHNPTAGKGGMMDMKLYR